MGLLIYWFKILYNVLLIKTYRSLESSPYEFVLTFMQYTPSS